LAFQTTYDDHLVISLTITGSFRAPPPGKPVSEPYDEKHLKLGMKLDDINDKIARDNFRVVIMRPKEVEATDLSDPLKARRHRYTYGASDGSWNDQELWP
jgi:pyridoxamine 5'-phosphate oxidase